MNQKGVCPPYKKSTDSTSVDSATDYLAEEENNISTRNQKLAEEFKKLLPKAKNRKISRTIAHMVGERIRDWKMFACALGIDDDCVLRNAEYWASMLAPVSREYPLEKLLLEDFKQRQGNLGDLIEVLISKELYAVLKEIKPQVLDCIQNPHDDSYESPSENRQFNFTHGVPVVNINITDLCTVKFNSNCPSTSNFISSQSARNANTESSNSTISASCNCSSSLSETTVDTENSSSTSASSSITDDNCKDGVVKLGNSKTSVYVPNKENSTFQTFRCSTESVPSLQETNSVHSFNCNAPKPTAYPSIDTSSFSSNGTLPEVLTLQEILCSLSLTSSVNAASESMKSTSSASSSPSTVTGDNLPNAVTTASGPLEPVIYVFITHTMADTCLAKTVARRLREDFNIIAVTQFQLFTLFAVNHGDIVSMILKDVHYVMPLVTQHYLDEIGVPENRDDCPHQQMSVRNVFTALQADYFNNSSLNWKIRPVVAEGTSMRLAREKQELCVALRLWQDWELVGLMLRNTLLYWKSRTV